MYGIGTIAFIPSSTTAEPPVASLIVANQQPAIGRLPATQVAASVAYSALQNQTQGAPNFARAAVGAPVAGAASSFSAEPAAAVPGGYITSFPTLFLAQLMGQGDDAQTRSIVLTYEQLVEYSNVKYLPSNAAKPQMPSAAEQLFSQIMTADAPTVRTQQQQQQMRPAQVAQEAVQEDAGDMPLFAGVAAAVPVKMQQAPARKPVSPAQISSSAYAASAQRNVSTLDTPQQELALA